MKSPNSLQSCRARLVAQVIHQCATQTRMITSSYPGGGKPQHCAQRHHASFLQGLQDVKFPARPWSPPAYSCGGSPEIHPACKDSYHRSLRIPDYVEIMGLARKLALSPLFTATNCFVRKWNKTKHSGLSGGMSPFWDRRQGRLWHHNVLIARTETCFSPKHILKPAHTSSWGKSIAKVSLRIIWIL